MIQKREHIVKKAAKLIHLKGYRDTSMEEILTAAKISKGQFYYYFSSKEELGLVILDYVFAKWKKNIVENILETNKLPKEKIAAMLDYIIECKSAKKIKYGCIFGNLSIELSNHSEVFRKKLAAIFDFWINEVKLVIDDIEEKDRDTTLDSRILAQTIVSVIEGVTLLTKNNRNIAMMVDVFQNMKKIMKI
ncbi:TetR/AcrR family transcriptional regulator [Pectinatus sottacetonis]|uniref:TetR/AcrR family transcriptional regulator n=1 Tax=Pectinatus sottacetonis TaxID=1002795 RepID=UPI0018C66998|nr:TetR/AcrR family transcriptional regulator [Pectinatus sottacetonis]